MASLKEVKERIGSVNSTRKITSAMKMIASSKLHRAQSTIANFLPYSEKLNSILSNLLSAETGFDSVFAQQREVKKVAILAFSSNSSLCGAFNANIIKDFTAVYDKYSNQVGKGNIEVYTIGKKISDAVRKMQIATDNVVYDEMLEKPTYQPVADLAQVLINKFMSKELDQIVLVYHHFKSTASQVIQNQTFLPFDLSAIQEKAMEQGDSFLSDYILEPSREEILSSLIPKVLVSQLYAALLDTIASEHAARTMAMQVATDNADELIQDLTIQYNKTRQQAITNELLDIIGGASALN